MFPMLIMCFSRRVFVDVSIMHQLYLVEVSMEFFSDFCETLTFSVGVGKVFVRKTRKSS